MVPSFSTTLTDTQRGGECCTVLEWGWLKMISVNDSVTTAQHAGGGLEMRDSIQFCSVTYRSDTFTADMGDIDTRKN